MALADNIIAYWKMDGNSNDAVGGGYNGTDTSISYAGSGKIGNDAGFTHASDSKIAITDAAALKPTSAFSLNLWIKTSYNNATGGTLGIFQSYSQNSLVAGIQIDHYPTTNKMRVVLGKNTNNTLHDGYDTVNSATSINDGAWHMWTIVFTGTSILIYLDGNSTPDASLSWTATLGYAATNYVRLGISNASGTDSAGYGFEGEMDEIGYWSRALSTSEIASLYNSGSGYQYPFSTNITVTPSVENVTWATQAPTIIAVQNITVSPSVETITWATQTPSISGEAIIAIGATLNTTWALQDPFISINDTTVYPGVENVTWAIATPTIIAIENIVVSPNVQTITFALPTPTISVVSNMTILPVVQNVVWAIRVPTILGDFWYAKFAAVGSDPWGDKYAGGGSDPWSNKY